MIIETSKISNIAFNILGIDIYWYAILIVTAIVIGIFWCKFHDSRYGIKFDNIIDLLIFVLPISFICARIYYCAFAWQEFSTDIFDFFNFRRGGLAIYGGLIGGTITTFVFCKVKKIAFLDLIDFIIPVVSLGQAIGRWGNFFNKEAYGTSTNSFLKMEIIENGKLIYVHPTFLYESLVTFFCFILLSILSKKRQYKGEITLIYLIIYSFARMIIEGIRTDSLMLYDVRISQVLSLVIFLVFSGIFAYKTVKCRTQEKKVDK